MTDDKQVSPLAKALGIVPETTPKKTFVVKKPINPDKIESDADHARDTLYLMVSNNNEAIDQLMEIARESMHPRAFEVLGQLIKNNAEIADKLLKVHSDKAKITGNTGSTGNTNMQFNGNVAFIGTTTDLLDTIRKEQEKLIFIQNDETE